MKNLDIKPVFKINLCTLLLILPNIAFAGTITDGCSSSTGENMCLKANTLAKTLTAIVPTKLNDRINIISASAAEQTVTITHRINYDAAELKRDANELEVTPESITQTLATVITGQLCAGSLKDDINKGLVIKADFQYSDSTPYTLFVVNHCE